jgi:hypothetical protein
MVFEWLKKTNPQDELDKLRELYTTLETEKATVEAEKAAAVNQNKEYQDLNSRLNVEVINLKQDNSLLVDERNFLSNKVSQFEKKIDDLGRLVNQLQNPELSDMSAVRQLAKDITDENFKIILEKTLEHYANRAFEVETDKDDSKGNIIGFTDYGFIISPNTITNLGLDKLGLEGIEIKIECYRSMIGETDKPKFSIIESPLDKASALFGSYREIGTVKDLVNKLDEYQNFDTPLSEEKIEEINKLIKNKKIKKTDTYAKLKKITLDNDNYTTVGIDRISKEQILEEIDDNYTINQVIDKLKECAKREIIPSAIKNLKKDLEEGKIRENDLMLIHNYSKINKDSAFNTVLVSVIKVSGPEENVYVDLLRQNAIRFVEAGAYAAFNGCIQNDRTEDYVRASRILSKLDELSKFDQGKKQDSYLIQMYANKIQEILKTNYRLAAHIKQNN